MTKVMAKSTLNKRDWAVRYLPYRVLKQICTKLNIRSQFFDDFRMVAEQLGTDKDTVECIGQSENPTYGIFTSCHRDAKVGRLIEILHEIERQTIVITTSSSLLLTRFADIQSFKIHLLFNPSLIFDHAQSVF